MHLPRQAQRVLAVLASLAAAAGGTAAVGLVRAAADGQDAGLSFAGFIHASALSAQDGSPATPMTEAVVGADDSLGEVVLYSNIDKRFYMIDPKSLAQVGSIDSQASGFPGPLVTAVDTAMHRVYLGTQVSTQGNCFTLRVSCGLGPTAVSPQIETLDLAQQKSQALWTLPSYAAGMDIAALTPMTATNGRHLLFALLYQDTSNFPNEPGVAHKLTLVALDADKLTDPTADATLWTHDIPECANLPSWTKSSSSLKEFLGVDPGGRFVYFACRGFSEGSEHAHFTPSGALVIDLASSDGSTNNLPASAAAFTDSFYPYGADVTFSSDGGDSSHGLLELVETGNGDLNKLFVFDAVHRAWIGSMPFVAAAVNGQSANKNMWGVTNDPTTGRAYIFYPTTSVISSQFTQIPTPQGQNLPLGDLFSGGGSQPFVDPATQTLFLPAFNSPFQHSDFSSYPSDDSIAVYRDTRPVPPPDAVDNPDDQTHDIPLTDDTPVTFGSFASAYGAKAIVVGGLHSAPGVGVAYGSGPAADANNGCDLANFPFNTAGASTPLPCDGLVPNTSDGDRTFTFGQVTHAEMSTSAASASATTMSVDDSSDADSKALTSYNPAVALWDRFIQPNTSQDPPSAPGGTPSPPAFSAQVAPATCSDYGGGAATGTGSGATAGCDHGSQQADAAAASDALAGPGGATAEKDPSTQASPLEVGYAGAATTVLHTADNQAVTEAKAVARNISLSIPSGPTVTIGEVTTAAMSSTAGRPNTASSQFTRTVNNVVVRDPSGQVVYSCGFAGADSQDCDPRQLTDAVSAQSPSPVLFLMPTPDPDARATPGGAEAEIIKSKYQYWNDYFTNADKSVEIPGLQIVLIGDQDQPSRVVLSLAAVHVESHDAIGLPPPPAPQLPDPTLKLSLTDGSTPAVPLAGGEFSLVADDGTTAATCSTAADGIGSCSFPDVKPGSYTIKETKAPPGYAIAPDYKLSLDPGQDYTATFVNLLAIGAVHVSLTSAVDKKPLAGAIFAMYAGSSVLGTPLATCTTAKDGTCGFTKVPLASYTMHQQTTPKGLLAAKDFPFDLSDPGQDATLTFVDGTPAVKAQTGKFIPGKPAVPPHTMVVGGGQGMPAVPAAYSTGTSNIPPVLSTAPSDQAPIVAGLPQRLANLPAQLAKLLTHSPQQAVLLLFMWLVFGLPVYLWARRRQLLTATEGT